MPGTNLTREEAQQRAAVVTPTEYVVELDLSGERFLDLAQDQIVELSRLVTVQ